jgi:hypothetical protein
MFLGDSGDHQGRGRWKTVLDASKTFEMFQNIRKFRMFLGCRGDQFRDGRWKCV